MQTKKEPTEKRNASLRIKNAYTSTKLTFSSSVTRGDVQQTNTHKKDKIRGHYSTEELFKCFVALSPLFVVVANVTYVSCITGHHRHTVLKIHDLRWKYTCSAVKNYNPGNPLWRWRDRTWSSRCPLYRQWLLRQCFCQTLVPTRTFTPRAHKRQRPAKMTHWFYAPKPK